MNKAGFIGLGSLGLALCQRLAAEGVTLDVWNRSPEKAAALKIAPAANPAELFRANQTVFINLLDSQAVLSVLKQPNVLSSLKDTLVIDTTTNHYEEVPIIHETLDQAGAFYIECPVLGSVVPARLGKLVVLASALKPDIFEKARPWLKLIGSEVFFLGKPGRASKMKLINNHLLGAFMASIAEALALANKTGFNTSEAVEVLLAGAGASTVFSAKKQKILDQDYQSHFSAALMRRDLGYASQLAAEHNMPLFTCSLAHELYSLVLASGGAQEDFSAICKTVDNLAGGDNQ